MSDGPTIGTGILIPVSPGELIDKLTILRVKVRRLKDAAKLRNVETELAMLEQVARRAIPADEAIARLTAELVEVNSALWDIEEGKRDCERRSDFGDAFVQLARAVYVENDRRAALKRSINVALGSDIIEEKSYSPYRE